MRRTLFFMFVGIAAVAFSAETTARPADAVTCRERMLRATGGFVDKAAVGKIVVVNAQRRIGGATVRAVVDKLVFQTKFAVEVVDTGAFSMFARPEGASAAVVLADDASLPLSVISPEILWGLVNVEKLGDQNVESRFTKEFVRVTTLAFGGAISQFAGSPLNPTSSAKMLDRYVTDNYTFDCQQAILRNLMVLGMRPFVRTSYRRACEEGWAPAPTNEVQRKIWERVNDARERGPVNAVRIAP